MRTAPSDPCRRQSAADGRLRSPAATPQLAGLRAQPDRTPRDRISSCITAPRGCRHRLEDLDVPGATAKIARKPLPNVIHGRLGLFAQHMNGRENHSRRANAALRAAKFQKCLLQAQARASWPSPSIVTTFAPCASRTGRGSYQRARHPSSPNMRRTRPLRILPLCQSIRVVAAARPAVVPSDTRARSSVRHSRSGIFRSCRGQFSSSHPGR